MTTSNAERALDRGDAIRFGPFCLDSRAGRLTCAGETVPLRPKTWSVLLHLLQRPGVLISKDELLDAVWPDVAVTLDTVTKSIGELRVALGDDSRTPRYIETVHRRGFRFVAEVTPGVAARSPRAGSDNDRVVTTRWQPERPLFVGRVAELRRLDELLARTHAGTQQMAFVTGGEGIGKSALVETFLASAAERADVWIARGTCVEQHGAREAYMPVLDAIERLTRRGDAERLTTLLRRTAPTWLLQMPWLMGDDAQGAQRSLPAAGPERMLREFAAWTEALTRDVTLILVLEDLHWSDPPTVDLLSFLGRRPEAARLLVVGTHRPAEAAVREHPLSAAIHTLKARRQCVDLPVHELSKADVHAYLERRFPDARFSSALAPVLHGHTDGNPLFMVAVVEHILSRGLILETAPGWALSVDLECLDLGVPDDVGQMVEAQIDMLSPADRELLEVASVGGGEVDVPALGGAAGIDVGAVEMRCETLARARRFLRAAGRTEWPDGTVTRRYAFAHELYRRVVYAGVPDRQRVLLHRRMAETLVAAYGDRSAEIAPQLAVHYEKSQEHLRAVQYLTIAGARARQRFANREAIGYLEAALAAVARVPDQDVRQRRELEVRLVLGPALSDLGGYAVESVRENYERADALCGQVGTAAEHFELVYALCHFHTARGNIATDAMAARLDALADELGTAEARLRADSILVRVALVAGRFAEVRTRMEGLVGLESPLCLVHPPEFGPDPVIDANSHYALALWFLGHHARARATAEAGIGAARANAASLTTRAAAVSLGGVLEIFCGNATAALALGEEAVGLCDEQGFAYWRAMALAVRGQARVLSGQTQEGLDELVRARAALQATATLVFSTHILAFLGDAHRRNGNFAEALAATDEGLAVAESTLDRTYRPELWRLKGELLLARRRDEPAATTAESSRQEGEHCLLRALELARECEAKSLELRAAISLARLWQASERRTQACAVLRSVCEWFGPGAGGADLDDARALLDELRRSSGAPRSRRAPRRLPALRRKVSANLPETFRT